MEKTRGMADETITRISRVRRWAADGTARALRERAGLSYRDIASEAGIRPATVWRYENGKRKPHGPSALRYLAVLDLLQKVSQR